MSQEKVDRYKAEKANRKQNMQKEKYKSIAVRTCTIAVCAVILGWVGYSVYHRYETTRPTEYLELDSAAITDYESSLEPEEKE